MTTMAYKSGLVDGADWDLDGYASVWEAADQPEGWSTATINAVGSTACAREWGVPAEGEEWEQACYEYDRGVVAALRERARREPLEVQP